MSDEKKIQPIDYSKIEQRDELLNRKLAEIRAEIREKMRLETEARFKRLGGSRPYFRVWDDVWDEVKAEFEDEIDRRFGDAMKPPKWKDHTLDNGEVVRWKDDEDDSEG